ncbi:MAG: SHOCT domain-containing protein [Oscillospiraceae bacterium]|nr:SHOCT domain-containing protein [Oscillospiraceae bacterium]
MSVDAVSEIQRFKALVDQGILTEEEFAAKKRQLLGI